eukprot:ctg_281.g175
MAGAAAVGGGGGGVAIPDRRVLATADVSGAPSGSEGVGARYAGGARALRTCRVPLGCRGPPAADRSSRMRSGWVDGSGLWNAASVNG